MQRDKEESHDDVGVPALAPVAVPIAPLSAAPIKVAAQTGNGPNSGLGRMLPVRGRGPELPKQFSASRPSTSARATRMERGWTSAESSSVLPGSI